MVLKTCEFDRTRDFTSWLKHELKKKPTRLIGGRLWSKVPLKKKKKKAIHKKTNWEDYGGSPLLGVNGICIIAHGASTSLAVQNAVAQGRGRIY